MREVRLTPEQEWNSHGSAILRELESLEGAPRVYQIFVRGMSKDYTLNTTSKDLHLGVGRFSFNGLYHFCQFLDGAFKPEQSRQLLLTISGSQKRQPIAILVTVTAGSPTTTIYHLSPAN